MMPLVLAQTINDSVWSVVINRRGRILIARRSKRSNNPKLWNFPGGGVGKDEEPRLAALRELQEEVGISPSSVALMRHEVINTRDRTLKIYIFLTIGDVKVKHNKKEIDKSLWLSVNKLEEKSKKLSDWHFPTFMALHNPVVFDGIKAIANKQMRMYAQEKKLDKAEKRQRKVAKLLY